MQLIILTYALILLIENISAQTCTATTKCTTKACCSKYGNCGYGPDFCGTGCLNECGAKPECGNYSDTSQCPLKVCCSKFGFCGTTTDFCSTECQSNCKQPAAKKCASGRNLLNIGYYASWSANRICNKFDVSNIDPRNYTHLNYAFGNISKGVLVDPSGDEERRLNEFVALRDINPDLKLLISVGGWVFNDPGPTRHEFHDIISSEANRNKFISSVASYLDKYHLNGIDIDYEYPGAEDRGGSPSDTDNYVKLVKEMRASLGSHLITIAAPASYWYLRHFKIGEMSKHLDWINVMTYDIHGVWDKEIESLGPILKSHTNITEIKEAINLFLRDGVESEKIVLGLGYYGRGFTLENVQCKEVGCRFKEGSVKGQCTNASGILAWFEINQILADKHVTPTLDTKSMSKIATWDNQWIAFDDYETLAYKREYASVNCFKGVMIWSIDMGVDRTAGSDTFPKVGSISFAEIKLSINYLKDGNLTFGFTSSRDSRYGFDSYVLYVEEHDEHSITKRQTGNNCRTMDITALLLSRGIITLCEQMISRIFELLANRNGLVEMIINDARNPIARVFYRHLSWGHNRPEFVSGLITPAHLRLGVENRVNFNNSIYNETSTTYMRANMNGTYGDERGHIFANMFSGPPQWYNMVTQHNSVNRDYRTRWLINDWYNTELEMRDYLQQGRGNIQWNVAMTYANLNTARPSGFTYEAIFIHNGGGGFSIFGYIPNCQPGDGVGPDGRCLGFH